MLVGLTGGDVYMADDIAQDTFLKAWTYINSYKMNSSFKTWLFSIAYRTFYDYARVAQKHLHSRLEECDKVSEQWAVEAERTDALYRALDMLRPEERTAIVLFFLEGQKQEHIAQVMGFSISGVKTLIFRGKQHLAELLKDTRSDKK